MDEPNPLGHHGDGQQDHQTHDCCPVFTGGPGQERHQGDHAAHGTQCRKPSNDGGTGLNRTGDVDGAEDKKEDRAGHGRNARQPEEEGQGQACRRCEVQADRLIPGPGFQLGRQLTL